MLTDAITMSVSALWQLVLLVLGYMAWKHLHHWSVFLVFVAIAVMTLLQIKAASQVYVLWSEFYYPSSSSEYLVIEILRITRVIGCIVGTIGGIAFLVALREKRWSLQTLRNPAEAAQPGKGAQARQQEA